MTVGFSHYSLIPLIRCCIVQLAENLKPDASENVTSFWWAHEQDMSKRRSQKIHSQDRVAFARGSDIASGRPGDFGWYVGALN